MACRVLLVDDSRAMRTFIRRVLDISGFEVGEYLEAANGADALRVLAARPVDLILTDINMPHMDGEEFVLRLEQDEALRCVPVVVVSTDGTDKRIMHLLAMGAQGYVIKPFVPETLRAEVERVLGGSDDRA